MSTSLIKSETNNSNMEPSVKISRMMNGNATIRKNDLVSLLREENDALYEEYGKLIKRNSELRAIVEKQQKVINAIYNAELKILMPPDEKAVPEIEPPLPEVQNTVIEMEQPAVETVAEVPSVEAPVEPDPAPEVKPPQPLSLNDLAQRIHRLQRKQWQSQPSLIEKANFLLALYNAPEGIPNMELFAARNLTRVTGLRYVSFFRKFSMISNGSHICLTPEGKKFVEGAPAPEWDKFRVKNWRPVR
jgi:hypothetical protein